MAAASALETRPRRVVLIVLDSVGIGQLADADAVHDDDDDTARPCPGARRGH